MALADWKPETWTAIYAAIVGTGALLLNLKSWLDSGVKLSIALIPDGVIMGGDPRYDDKDIVIVTVTNRGDAPTMITNLCLLEMPTLCSRLRRRPVRSFVIPNPQPKGYPPNIPFDLAPSKSWTGVLRKRQDKVGDMHTGNFYVAVYASHRNKAYLSVIPKLKPKISNGNGAKSVGDEQ